MDLARSSTLGAVVFVSLLAASCGGSTENLFTPIADSGAGGADASPEGAAGSGGTVTPDASESGTDGNVPEAGPDAPCSATSKFCSGTCVALDDPNYGCSADLCSPCTVQHATPVCANQACSLKSCADGWADCDANPLNGCETSVDNDPSNCGACAKPCSFPHASATCNQGTCSMGACDMGFADCDANPGNGCEITVQIDVQNCGGCGVVCAAPHASSACYGGKCALGTCDVPWGECDNNVSNGCETNLNTDPVHCSACNILCTPPDNASALCTAGQCSLGACDPGFANCDSNAANGCEINTQIDPNNCGTCGKVCGTGGCQASQCSSPTTPVVISTGGGNPYDLAVDAQYVYWSSSSGVSRALKSGGSPLILTPGDSANGIAIDGLRVYFSDNVSYEIKSVPLAGGTVTTLSTGLDYPWRVTTDGTSVFFTDSTANTVSKVPKTGGATTVVASSQTGAAGIAHDATTLYWTTNTGGVMKMPLAGGTIVTIVSGETNPMRVAVDATSAYFSCYATTGAIKKVPLGGGAVTTLAASQTSPVAVAVDSGWVYWTDTSSVKKMPVGGGATVVLASGLSQPNALAVDAARVYWTDFGDGTVMAVAK